MRKYLFQQASTFLAYHTDETQLARYEDSDHGTTLVVEAFFEAKRDLLGFDASLMESVHSGVDSKSIERTASSFDFSSLRLNRVYPFHYHHDSSPLQSVLSESTTVGFDSELFYYQLVAVPPPNARPQRCHLVDKCFCDSDQFRYMDCADCNLVALPQQIHSYFDGTGIPVLGNSSFFLSTSPIGSFPGVDPLLPHIIILYPEQHPVQSIMKNQ